MDSSSKTVKILSLDGGGMRGYFSATFLKRFCIDAGIQPNRLFEAFDIITGTSIGAIQGLGYAYGKTPEEMRQFFATKGSSIFAYSSILPLSAYKFSVIMGLPTYPSTFYAQAPLKAALEEVFGTTMKLSDLSGKVIIPSWNTHEDEAAIFSNISGLEPFLSGADRSIVDVGLATSAAPLYFPPASVNSHTMIDGGVYVNNPVTLAYSVAKKMFPACTRFCILSVGTGVAHNDFIPEATTFNSAMNDVDSGLNLEVQFEMNALKKKLLKKYPNKKEQILFLTERLSSIAPYNVDYIFYLMDNVFIPGPQELNAKVMEFEATDVYDDIFFNRFQYQFLPGQDSSLDNYSPANLANLEQYANSQYDVDLLKIKKFIAHFNARV
jgi:predicted acylesterase/phospholipase RssA